MNTTAKIPNLADFMAMHATPEACLERISERRWPQGFVCPRCGHAGGYPLGGRRGFECSGCGKQTGITKGTAFAYLKLPLPKVFLAMYLLAANKQGISSKSLMKHLGCSYPTAWHLGHKLRHAMKERDNCYQLAGLVEVDEGYFGGIAAGPGMGGRSRRRKTPVVALVEKRGENCTGYVALRPVVKAAAPDLIALVVAKVKPGSRIRTDAWASYNSIAAHGFEHEREHSIDTRSALQFKLVHRQISNCKNWLLGTHRNACRRHLDLYTAEFAWRTNRRNRYVHGRADGQERTISDRMLTTMTGGTHWTWSSIRKRKWMQEEPRIQVPGGA